MASSLALKRLLTKSLSSPLCPAAKASRYFNTKIIRDYREDDHSINSDRRSLSCSGFLSSNTQINPLYKDLFSNQIYNIEFLSLFVRFVFANEKPEPSLESDGSIHGESIPVGGWEAKVTEEALQLRVEQNTLIIKGESGGEEEGGKARTYISRIDLPRKLYISDQIKAEMKKGALRVVVPWLRIGMLFVESSNSDSGSASFSRPTR